MPTVGEGEGGCYSLWDVGGCGCGCGCQPCALPEAGLKLDATVSGGFVGAIVMDYADCTWLTRRTDAFRPVGCVVTGGVLTSFMFDVTCIDGVTTYRSRIWSGSSAVCGGAPTTTRTYKTDGTGSGLTLFSVSCDDPLQIVLVDGSGNQYALYV